MGSGDGESAMVRHGRRLLGGIAVFVAVAGGTTTAAAAEETDRVSGAAAATAEQPGAAAFIPMPDLGLAHRGSDGGINLFRMSLSDYESDFGVATPVRTLAAAGGFSFDRSRVIAGDFGNLTAGDDGSADHVLWLAGSDGGVKVVGVAGGSDNAPRLWHNLPRSAGWSWADSRPIAGDVNGDGWDDLMVVHRARVGNIVWVMLSNETRLLAPQRWGIVAGDFGSIRSYAADVDGDFNEDLLTTVPGGAGTAFTTSVLLSRLDGTGSTGSSTVRASFTTAAGWSYANSRQLTGDLTGDGLPDLVTVHRSGTGGVLVWVNANCSAVEGNVCFQAPVRWQTLNTWSYANSRQYLADTDGDYVDDLVSVHRSGNGGMFVWRHVSGTEALGAPEQIASLPPSSGWNWSLSRESVATTWGEIIP